MNIIFLTTLNPYDINNWSGTMFHVLQSFKKRHHVRVVGINLLSQSFYFVRNSYKCRLAKKKGHADEARNHRVSETFSEKPKSCVVVG